MPRYEINKELSFRYPKECTIESRFKGKGFRLNFDGLDYEQESYYVKWIQTKSAKYAWEWLANSPFDKKTLLSPIEKDVSVEGFRLKKLPSLTTLKLAQGEFASFRGSEYHKDYNGTEWIELTWARMYAHTVDDKLRVLGMALTAAGEAKAVTQRVRAHLMNFQSGFIYKPNGVEQWNRVPFPAKSKSKPKTKSVAPQGTQTQRRPAPTPSIIVPRVPATKQCGWCSGSGQQVCSSCNGSGGQYESFPTYDYEGNPGYEQRWVACFCGGGYSNCGYCYGRGFVEV